MSKKKVLIACGIFAEEVAYLLSRHQAWQEVEVVWLDAGLHSDLARLEKELAAAIAQAKSLGGEDIRLLFGRGCLPEMDIFAQAQGVGFASTQNCLAAFLGEARVKELEQNNTMLMTPAWVRVWPENMRRLSGWNEVDFRMNLGRYERILVLDAGIDPLRDEEILEFFDLAQVPVEVEALDLEHFQTVLKDLLD